MNELLLRRVLRTIAVAIAVAAFIDPAITSNRALKPEVVVQAVNASADSALTGDVATRLAKSFTVLDVPYAGAAATVLVGSHVPVAASEAAGVVFAVIPDSSASAMSMEAVHAPARATVDARVPVTASAHAIGLKGKDVQFTLRANNSVIDRITHKVESDNERFESTLSYVPTVAGAIRLRVESSVGNSKPNAADVVVDVRAQKWAVLFYDARPSWMSTFVRRALELDTRFAVTSRVVTSTNVSTDAGRPPGTLDDPSIAELYDAVVVGAPETLSERDVQGAERFLRQRGGSVVLLFDGNKSGAYSRLADIGSFTAVTNPTPAVIADQVGDTLAMRATEWMYASRVPTGARVLASTRSANKSADGNAIVYSVNAGAGRVYVSGALDAWKFRDAAQSGFERFWQQTIADAASSSIDQIDLHVSAAPVRPDDATEIIVSSRRAALASANGTTASTSIGSVAPIRATATVSVESSSGSSPVRVWPTGAPGVFRGTLNAPHDTGVYRISANVDGASASAPLVVATDVRSANPVDVSLLTTFTKARGGSVVPASRLSDMPGTIERVLRPDSRRVVWHPMRSLWWLMPFGLLLSAEWWLRRRRGLP